MRHVERERRRIAALRSRRPELSEALGFLEAIGHVAERFASRTFDRSRLGARAAGVQPLRPDRFPLDETAAAEAFLASLEAFVKATGSGAAKKAMAALRDGRLDPRSLARAYCAGDVETFEDAAKRVAGLEPEFLVSLAELAVKPQFIAAARALEDEDRAAPARSDGCPVCGSPPDLALVTDTAGAERTMLAVCRLCESEWPISRVRCNCCGNEESETLGYLRVDGEEDSRASTCDRCHRYLPVLDVAGRLEIAPAVERVALAHLDIVAQERGYRPLTFLLAHKEAIGTDYWYS